MSDPIQLYYSHDPMCSFCWAFRPIWTEVQARLHQKHPDLEIIYLMGGLAPDSDEPMPEEVRHKVMAAWNYIEQNIPGSRFNYDFWSLQQPRRSTYPSCRAVMAARMMEAGIEDQMILAIQQAYYLNARNPSNEDTLVQCATSIGLDADRFTLILRSADCEAAFTESRQLSRDLGIASFPSLVAVRGNSRYAVPVDYNSASTVMDKLNEAISLLSGA